MFCLCCLLLKLWVFIIFLMTMGELREKKLIERALIYHPIRKYGSVSFITVVSFVAVVVSCWYLCSFFFLCYFNIKFIYWDLTLLFLTNTTGLKDFCCSRIIIKKKDRNTRKQEKQKW